jgi:hypothetical protein
MRVSLFCDDVYDHIVVGDKVDERANGAPPTVARSVGDDVHVRSLHRSLLSRQE